MRFALLLVATFLLTITSTSAQDGRPSFDIAATKTCFQNNTGNDRIVCVGLSASICMESESGGSTVGMGACLDSELEWWDAKLNKTYKSFLKLEQASDKEAESEGYRQPNKEAAIREMQKTWIPYRDANCEHVAAQWGGGTGAGPAFLDCLLGETARQTLVLIDRMESYTQR